VRASGDLPLVFDRTAVFFWRGAARTVEWRGDLVGWGPSDESQGRRVGSTDIWTWHHELLPASRADYKVVVDGETWLVDPGNPHQQVRLWPNSRSDAGLACGGPPCGGRWRGRRRGDSGERSARYRVDLRLARQLRSGRRQAAASP
jgi:hypothetical protein